MLLQSKLKRSLKKLASKVKGVNNGSSKGSSPDAHESLSGRSTRSCDVDIISSNNRRKSSVSTGYFVVYVGDERQRFMVKLSYLMRPLFKMMLEKSSNEFGFEQRDVLVVPCSVLAFQETLNVIKCSKGRFEFGEWVEEFL